MYQEREFDEIMQEWESICATAAEAPAEPNRALVTTILDNAGKLRRVALLYSNADNWFDYRGWSEQEEMHRGIIHLLQRDKTVLGFQTQAFTIKENGLIKAGATFQPSKVR